MDHNAIFRHGLREWRHVSFIGDGRYRAQLFQVKLRALQIFHRLGASYQPGGSEAFVLFVKLEAVVHPDKEEELDHYGDQDGTQNDISGIVKLTEDVHADEEQEHRDRVALDEAPYKLCTIGNALHRVL